MRTLAHVIAIITIVAAAPDALASGWTLDLAEVASLKAKMGIDDPDKCLRGRRLEHHGGGWWCAFAASRALADRPATPQQYIGLVTTPRMRAGRLQIHPRQQQLAVLELSGEGARWGRIVGLPITPDEGQALAASVLGLVFHPEQGRQLAVPKLAPELASQPEVAILRGPPGRFEQIRVLVARSADGQWVIGQFAPLSAVEPARDRPVGLVPTAGDAARLATQLTDATQVAPDHLDRYSAQACSEMPLCWARCRSFRQAEPMSARCLLDLASALATYDPTLAPRVLSSPLLRSPLGQPRVELAAYERTTHPSGGTCVEPIGEVSAEAVFDGDAWQLTLTDRDRVSRLSLAEDAPRRLPSLEDGNLARWALVAAALVRASADPFAAGAKALVVDIAGSPIEARRVDKDPFGEVTLADHRGRRFPRAEPVWRLSLGPAGEATLVLGGAGGILRLQVGQIELRAAGVSVMRAPECEALDPDEDEDEDFELEEEEEEEGRFGDPDVDPEAP